MTRSRIVGLSILGLLSLIDLAGPLVTDGEHPPMEVALAGAVLGLVSLVLIVYVARGATRAVAPLVVVRVISALTAAPAFFIDDVPAIAMVAAGVIVALTVAGVVMVTRPLPDRELVVR